MQTLRPLRRLRSFPHDETAAVLAEAAIVLPILLTLMIGLIDFGRILHHNHIVEGAARDAARFLSRSCVYNGSNSDCPSTVTAAAVYEEARNIALYGSPTVTDTPALWYWEDQGKDATITFSAASARPFPSDPTKDVFAVTVAIDVVYQDGILAALGIGPTTMRARHTQRWVGE